MTNDAIPSGVSAIFVADGRVIAHVADFNRSTPGGYTLREAQESRARMQLARAVVKELSSPLLYEHLDAYDCEQILRKIPGKVHVMAIGGTSSSAGDEREQG